MGARAIIAHKRRITQLYRKSAIGGNTQLVETSARGAAERFKKARTLPRGDIERKMLAKSIRRLRQTTTRQPTTGSLPDTKRLLSRKVGI